MLLGLAAIIAATTLAATNSRVQGATPAKNEAVLRLNIGDPDFDLLRISVADIVKAIRAGASIGSSGNDGFAVDSFFDITYRAGLPGSTEGGVVNVEIRAVPNNPDMNPGTVIDGVHAKITALLRHRPREFAGHVTLIK